MCKHTFKQEMAKNARPTCTLAEHFTPESLEKALTEPQFKDLPLDKKGMCLFHSKDLSWKHQNQFHDRLIELINRLETDPTTKSINLNEATIVGIEDIASQEAYGQMGVHTKPLKRITLHGLELSKPLLFKNAIFADNLLIDFCKFESLNLESAIFKGVFELKSSYITEDTSFIRAVANNNFYIEATQFDKIVEFTEAVFNYQFLLLEVVFKEQAIFEEVRFTDDDEINYVQINATFGGYTSFQKAHFRSIVHFANCTFNDETYFIDTGFGNRLHIDKVNISNNIYFQSKKESAKLFQADVDFDFDETAFQGAGQVIFENANLFNLNTSFKQNLRKLERLQRVVIRKGCLKYRLSYVFLIENLNQIGNFLVKEFYQLLTNYFEVRFGYTLYVDFEKIDGGLQIIIHTDEAIAAELFEEMLRIANAELNQLITTQTPSTDIAQAEYFVEKSKLLSKFKALFIKYLSNSGFLDEAKDDGEEDQ